MKCPECGNDMVELSSYERHDGVTNETYKMDYRYNSCKCGYNDLPNEAVRGEIMLKSKEKRWQEWIFSQLHSFREIEEKFLNRASAYAMIRNYHGERMAGFDCAFKNKAYMLSHIDYECFHFELFGRKYYLKNSLEKYLYCGCGLWHLDNGLYHEWRNSNGQ